jgi:hypothetical protein
MLFHILIESTGSAARAALISGKQQSPRGHMVVGVTGWNVFSTFSSKSSRSMACTVGMGGYQRHNTLDAGQLIHGH